MDLDHDRLEQSLILLGDYLDSRKQPPIHIVVSGGAALLAAKLIERATYDLDILATRGEIDGEIRSARPLPDHFVEATRAVATELNLQPNWANSSTSLFMCDLRALPDSVWQNLHFQQYGNSLAISFVSREGQIFLKFWALLERDEARDLSDLLEMGITKPEAEKVLSQLRSRGLIDNVSKETVTKTWERIFDE